MKAEDQPHVIVTGGSRGIGRATVERLIASWNARCSVLDVEPERFAHQDVQTIRCDVTDQASVHDAVAEACNHAGPPRGLVTAAGVVSKDASISISAESWRRIVAVHLDGTLFACQAVAQRMKDSHGGAIVTLCSVAMDFGVPGRAAYAAAKAGVRSLTKTLACEWSEHGIRVNALAPGDVRTSMYDELIARGVLDEETVKAGHALKRIAEPSEIATAVEFLLRDSSSFVTGELLRVDGGFTVKKL